MNTTTIRFQYTRNRETLHRLDLDPETDLLIVGDPDNGSYEWVLTSPTEVRSHSDDGWGSLAAALRDGLNHYLD